MHTPIADFIKSYIAGNPHRLHMPGHKGVGPLGFEKFDITEISGADALYEADGIIAESENNASALFGTGRTLYSTEGSSQCIRAMLHLAVTQRPAGHSNTILAARNVHKAFIYAAALTGFDVDWLFPEHNTSICACPVSPDALDKKLTSMDTPPAAVYVTSPDYLGGLQDIRALAHVCHAHDTLLMVDNAHGAYLHFTAPNLHPMDLGADICCDSAHKTLPVLTGGAYLHLAKHLPERYADNARQAMALFGSTSPSYLILQSLDAANRYLTDYPAQLKKWIDRMDTLRSRLRQRGYTLYGSEPLKITIQAKPCGYTGEQLADILRRQNIEPEFADPDFIVLMISAETGEDTLAHLEEVLLQIPLLLPLRDESPVFAPGERALSIREAMLSCSEQLPAAQCLGRILAMPSVGCPPAVPILICGERIDAHAIGCFAYYGIDHCFVVKADT